MSQTENCNFHGLPALRLRGPDGSTVTVTLHGAHVVSWTSPQGVEQLYLSPNTRYEGGQAIRGGVPVVFPQFNTRGVLPRHGFARTCRWAALEPTEPAPTCAVTLALQSHKVIQSLWPYRFGCELTVALQDGSLVLTLTIRNLDSREFSFQAALHTYLAVGSITGLTLSGLEHSRFEDCTEAQGGVIKPHAPWQPPAPMDRIYFNAPQQLQLQSSLGQRSLQQSGFTDTVVWNPGAGAAGTPPDLPWDGHQQFLCVEAAQIGVPVLLQPTQVWSGTQTIGCARLAA
jgi:glucose-6-phosphate 1-epimerase